VFFVVFLVLLAMAAVFMAVLGLKAMRGAFDAGRAQNRYFEKLRKHRPPKA
jgi:Kef-type K+ transport system membrane component KefB